jgi:hypothetical protein
VPLDRRPGKRDPKRRKRIVDDGLTEEERAKRAAQMKAFGLAFTSWSEQIHNLGGKVDWDIVLGPPENRLAVSITIPTSQVSLSALTALMGFHGDSEVGPEATPGTRTKKQGKKRGRKASEEKWILDGLEAMRQGKIFREIKRLPSVKAEIRKREDDPDLKPGNASKAIRTTLRRRFNKESGKPN